MKVVNRRVVPTEARAVRTDLQRMVEQIRRGNPLNLGDRGPAVSALQRHLAATGIYTGPVSGTFDEATEFALKAFQKRLGVAETGTLDARGVAEVKKRTLFVKDGFAGDPAREGQAGSDILRVEKKLAKLGFLDAAKADGLFDAATTKAVLRYRKADRQLADGKKGIGEKFLAEVSRAEKGWAHDPFRRRELGGDKQLSAHKRLDELTEKAAAKGEGIGRGAKGRAVANVEKHLEAAGFELGTPNAEFGASTEAAVRAFQKRAG
ncbi:MAG: peptidoglycan-binding domain-containing protein, partial [Myxococcales bacterium]